MKTALISNTGNFEIYKSSLSIILSSNIRIENANFANCLVSCLTYINGRSRVSNAICFHLVSLDLSRTDASPGALYCLLYCSFQVELFYGLQNMASVVDRRNKCNQDEQPFRDVTSARFDGVDYSSVTCRMMVMSTPPRPPSPSPTPSPRGNKFAERTSSSSSIINSILCTRPMPAVSIRQTHVIHPSNAYSRLSPRQLGHVEGKPICK